MTDVVATNSADLPPPLPATVSPGAPARPTGLRKLRLALILVVFTVGPALRYAFNPTEVSFFPPCPLNKLTGLHCPGCGTTRALHHLLHGNVRRAFDLNPLLIASLPLIVYAAALDVWRFVRPPLTQPRPVRPWVLWTITAVVILYGVARNLPYPGFAWMAP